MSTVLTDARRAVISRYHRISTLTSATDAVAIGDVTLSVVHTQLANQSCNMLHIHTLLFKYFSF